ncbi:MAG TPA: hypothetical protein VID75_12430 [Acidimicrobiales bacterium]|jgi:hypothetical protein
MHDQGTSASPGADDAGAWQVRVVDTVEGVVTVAHDRVIRPLIVGSRAVVFGILIATMALVVSVLFSITVIRLLDVYAFRQRVWASDAVVGGLFAVGGLLAWSRRRPGDDTGAP